MRADRPRSGRPSQGRPKVVWAAAVFVALALAAGLVINTKALRSGASNAPVAASTQPHAQNVVERSMLQNEEGLDERDALLQKLANKDEAYSTRAHAGASSSGGSSSNSGDSGRETQAVLHSGSSGEASQSHVGDPAAAASPSARLPKQQEESRTGHNRDGSSGIQSNAQSNAGSAFKAVNDGEATELPSEQQAASREAAEERQSAAEEHVAQATNGQGAAQSKDQPSSQKQAETVPSQSNGGTEHAPAGSPASTATDKQQQPAGKSTNDLPAAKLAAATGEAAAALGRDANPVDQSSGAGSGDNVQSGIRMDATGANDQKALTAHIEADKKSNPVNAAAADSSAAEAAGSSDTGGQASGNRRATMTGETAFDGRAFGSSVMRLPCKKAKDSGNSDPGAKPADPKFSQNLSQLNNAVIDERQLDTGIIYYGDMARLRSFMHKLRHGQPVKMAAVGGSISAGLGDVGYGPEVYRRISKAFPQAGHTFHNGAVGGVMSMYMTSCIKWHVPADIDLIMVEFNVNDGFEPVHCPGLPCKVDYGNMNSPVRRAYERLLRKLLMLPHRPAVIMLQAFDFAPRLFMNSAEDQLGVFAQAYSVPWLSFRSTVWKRQQRNVPGYSIPDLLIDAGGGDKHPNAYGHQILADLVTGLLRRVGQGLIDRPFTKEDQSIVDEDLMDPVLPGNVAWDQEYCIIDSKFRQTVTESPGFQWVDEAKPHHLTHKWGFVATEAGSHLLFTISTAGTTQTGVENPHTVVTINHLKSYEHMGQAEVSCVKGCQCAPSTFDGHWEQRNSQLHMHRISVSQAEKCTLKIRVLEATSSGEHKVKVQGVVIADEASAANEFSPIVPQIIPADLMGASKLEDIPEA